jgi:hypothetical protein
MRYLMIKQPWPNLIVNKFKTLESRFWNRDCSYRGDILICASQKAESPEAVKRIMTPEQFKKFNDIKLKLSHDIYKPTGVAICVVRMIDYRPMNKVEDVANAFVAYQEGLKVLVFDNIRPVVSFPVKGMLGLLHLPDEYEKQIRFD